MLIFFNICYDLFTPEMGDGIQPVLRRQILVVACSLALSFVVTLFFWVFNRRDNKYGSIHGSGILQ
jgi:hypothetical protein